jgi:hypothetical protein
MSRRPCGLSIFAVAAISVLVALAYAITGDEAAQVRSGAANPGDSVVPWTSSSPISRVAAPSLTTPMAGKPVAVTLLVNGPARHGERFRFTVRLVNTGSRDIPLDPCPHYRVQMIKVVEVGFLNCAAAPKAIPAGGHVDFAMEVEVNSPAPLDRGELLWQLGGEGTEGATAVTQVPVRQD